MKVTKQIKVVDQTDESKILLQGEIVYNSIPYAERTQKYEDTMNGIRTGADGDHTDDLKLARKYYEILKEEGRIEKVDLKLEDGTEIKSVDDMYEYAEGIAVGNEVALQIISSQRLGKIKLN